MIELKRDNLVFRFPDVRKHAVLRIDFQRTLRIPDDGRDHFLPPGLGSFALRHVDDFPERIPDPWIEHGGVMLPMYQSEAMWLNFHPNYDHLRATAYPFAVKIAAGKINAVTGDPWDNDLHDDPQDYVSLPQQPWLDGYCVKKGVVRQFVAMPLGSGYSAEEQITGEAEYGGVQIVAYPMKREVYERRFREVREAVTLRSEYHATAEDALMLCRTGGAPDMGLAPGGRMKQEIYHDEFDLADWDTAHSSRCFVHIANSMVWRDVTGEDPPTPPPTAREYSHCHLPWFDYYDERSEPLRGGSALKKLKSVMQLGKTKGDNPLPENAPVKVERVVKLRKGLVKSEVREGSF